MKAAPLLRAWLHRLREQGLRLHVRHRWLGWNPANHLRFSTPQGEHLVTADAVIFAMGGGSWRKLGSDGAWVTPLRERGIDIAPLRPANCGFDLGWSTHFRKRFAGTPVKSVAAWTEDGGPRIGEFVITETGIEGSLIYALSAPLRDAIESRGAATLYLDLLPQHTAAKVAQEVMHPRGPRSLSSHLQSRLGLAGVKAGLLREGLTAEAFQSPKQLAAGIKALPLTVHATRPLDEAISSAGGISFSALNSDLMLHAHPGVFCAGEMLDWEAPTGGYLLTACFATGHVAGAGAARWLAGER